MLGKVLVAAIVCVLSFPSALADDDEDREDMFDAQRSGTILRLEEILDRLRPQIGDQIVEIEFKRSHSIAIYEIYYIDGNGRRREIEVDAATATILEMKEDD